MRTKPAEDEAGSQMIQGSLINEFFLAEMAATRISERIHGIPLPVVWIRNGNRRKGHRDYLASFLRILESLSQQGNIKGIESLYPRVAGSSVAPEISVEFEGLFVPGSYRINADKSLRCLRGGNARQDNYRRDLAADPGFRRSLGGFHIRSSWLRIGACSRLCP